VPFAVRRAVPGKTLEWDPSLREGALSVTRQGARPSRDREAVRDREAGASKPNQDAGRPEGTPGGRLTTGEEADVQ